MEERRSKRRLLLELPATYWVIGSEIPAHATVVNVSHIGVCFITDDRIEGEPEIGLEIDLEEENKVDLITKLIWSEDVDGSGKFRNGVLIIDDGSEDRKRFIAFCDRKLMNPPTHYS